MAGLGCSSQIHASTDDGGAGTGGAGGTGSDDAAAPADGDITGDGAPMSATPGHWDKLPAVPHPRFYTGVGAAGGKIYVVGGTLGGTTFDTATERFSVEVFDPTTAAWNALPDLPEAFIIPNVTGVGDQLFILGNLDTNHVYTYDATANAWVAKHALPIAGGRGGAAVGVSGTTIYLAGGVVRGLSANMLDTGVRQSTLLAYDTTADTWKTLPELPLAVGYATGAVVNNQLWVMGGSTDFARTDQVLSFDLATQQWATQSPLPVGLSSATGAAIGQHIFLIGGIATAIGRINGDTLELDLATSAWSTLAPLPTPRFAMGAAVIAGTIYVPTGEASTGDNMFGPSDAFEAFTP
jgi:N-acetylneuraminic acid mutarotase